METDVSEERISYISEVENRLSKKPAHGLHGAISQKTAFFIVTDVRSSNPTILARFEDFTAVTMKNFVFWDIKPQFVPHRRHITSPLQSPAS
jgi:hypothetical protein